VDVDVDGAGQEEGVTEVQPVAGRLADVLDPAVDKRQAGPDSRPVGPQELPADFLGC
jgi:hypothetical protein